MPSGSIPCNTRDVLRLNIICCLSEIRIQLGILPVPPACPAPLWQPSSKAKLIFGLERALALPSEPRDGHFDRGLWKEHFREHAGGGPSGRSAFGCGYLVVGAQGPQEVLPWRPWSETKQQGGGRACRWGGEDKGERPWAGSAEREKEGGLGAGPGASLGDSRASRFPLPGVRSSSPPW